MSDSTTIWFYWIDADAERVAGRSNSRAFALDSARDFATRGPADLPPRAMKVLARSEDGSFEELVALFESGGRQIDGIELTEDDFKTF